MMSDRSEAADVEVPGGDVIRGDAAPVEQQENLDAQEAIRARAHELYLKRGEGAAGDDLNDWLEAEREYHERRGESAPGDQPAA